MALLPAAAPAMQGWTYFTTPLLETVSSLLLAMGTWAVGCFVGWLKTKTSLVSQQNEAQITANFDDALQKALGWGLQQVEGLIVQKGWGDAEVKNQAVAHALSYVGPHFPGYLKAIGIDSANQDQMNTLVAQALDRAFPKAVGELALSPATPPADAGPG